MWRCVQGCRGAGYYRCGHKELRSPRYPGQQLWLLRVRTNRGGYRRAFSQDIQCQRARRGPHHAGSCRAPRRGRKHHQHWFRSEPITPAFSTVYTGSKGALDAITGVLARELGLRKIRVNTITAGMIETEEPLLKACSARTSRKSSWLKPY